MRGIVVAAVAAALTAGVAALAIRSTDDRSPASPPPAEAASTLGATAAHTISVRARGAQHLDAVDAALRALGYVVLDRNDELLAIHATPPTGHTMSDAATELRHVEGVLYAEPSYAMFSVDSPSDPLYARQKPYYDAVHAPQAWDIETGKSYVVVAVVDSGIDLTHPDLTGRIWVNAREVANNNVDDDGNGCIDDVNGCAFSSAPSPGCATARRGNVRDDLGHGTFVAGVIAATGNNGQGVVGVARGVTIMPVKASDCTGTGNIFDVADAILYAANNGARVINLSLGTFSDSLILRDAVRIATEEKNAIIVAAAGNSGASGVAYPARYTQALAVGAASSGDSSKRADFSTYGPEVDVVSIGEDIVSTVPSSACQRFVACLQPGYGIGDGTSFTAPQVSGLAALILSRKPFTQWRDVVSQIRNSARALPAGDAPNWAGDGIIDMYEALKPPYRLGVPGTNKN